MEDTITQDSAAADSSPALEVPRDPQANAHWRMTGELPPSKAASTPAPPAKGKPPEENTAPASETGESHQKLKTRSAADARLSELLADLKAAGLSPIQLKAFKENFQPKRETTQQAEPPSTAATEKTGNPAELKAPVKPKAEEFKTYEEFDAAKDKYYEELADYRAETKFREREQKAQQEASQRSVHEKITEAVKHYGGESGQIISSTARALFDEQKNPILPPAVVGVLNDSPVWPHLLYTLGGKPEELAAFVALSKTSPNEAIRKVIVMEGLIQAELKGGKPSAATSDESDERAAPRGEDGKFKKTAPDKSESNAPPPPREVSGRGTPPPDDVDSAVKNGDMRAYMRAQNARAAARRRG